MESRIRGRAQYVMTSFVASRCRPKRSIAHLQQVEMVVLRKIEYSEQAATCSVRHPILHYYPVR